MEIKANSPKSKTYLYGIGIVIFASIILFLIEGRNHGIGMADLEVYYRSAIRMLRGDNLYQIQFDDHYVFKYAPACAMMFIPLTIFPFSVAKIIYWIFLTGVAASSFFLCIQLVSPGLYKKSSRKFNLLIFLLTFSLGLFLYREFRLGQVNIVLFLSYLFMLRAYQLKKPIPLALIWAAGIMFKPWGLIFVPFFLLKKNYKVIISFMIFALLIFFLPIVFYGYSDIIEQNRRWFNELTVELFKRQDLGTLGNHTFFSVIYRYSPLRFIEITGYWKGIYYILILGLAALATFHFIQRGRKIKQKEVATWGLLIAMMPLIAQSSYNVFLLVGLALTIVLVNFKQLPLLLKTLFIVGVILLGGNYNDLWGTELSDKFVWLSFVAIGGILVLVDLFYLRFKKIA